MYRELGLHSIVNVTGAVTLYGGSLMPSEVIEAIAEASRCFIDLDELLEATSKKIAAIIGTEGALIVGGAAAGMAISVAACIAGTDPWKIERLPDTEGLKNEVIVLKAHRNPYDQAYRIPGATLIEVGFADRAFSHQIEAAICDRTAAIAYSGRSELCLGSIPLEDVVEVAHAAEIPVIVDAAAELPPPSNLHRFTDLGADLVAFSGGKDIRGPQGSGLLVGRKDLLRACAANSNPHHSIGRPMKADKESIIGLTKALELYLQRDFEAEMCKHERQVSYFLTELSKLPFVTVERTFTNPPGVPPLCIPKAYVTIDKGAALSKQQLIQMLREGEPRIEVRNRDRGIILNPHFLAEAEEEVVVKEFAACMRRPTFHSTTR